MGVAGSGPCVDSTMPPLAPSMMVRSSRGEDAATFVLEMLGGESFTCWAIDHAERTDLVASLREQHAAARAEMENIRSAIVYGKGQRELSTSNQPNGKDSFPAPTRHTYYTPHASPLH